MPAVSAKFQNIFQPTSNTGKVDNTTFSILWHYFKWAGIIFEISRDQPPSRDLQRWAKPVFLYFDDVKGGSLKNLILVISFFYFLAVTKKLRGSIVNAKQITFLVVVGVF